MRAKDIMTTPAVCVRPSTSIREVAQILAENGFTAAPVVDEGDRLLGLVSEADLIRERFGLHPVLPGRDHREPRRTAGEVMTWPVESVSPNTTLTALAKCMISGRRRSMPVVEGDRVVGVVARRDLVEVISRTDDVILQSVHDRLEELRVRDRWRVRVQAGVVHLWADDVQHAPTVVEAVESISGVMWVTVSGPGRPSASHRVGNTQAPR